MNVLPYNFTHITALPQYLKSGDDLFDKLDLESSPIDGGWQICPYFL